MVDVVGQYRHYQEEFDSAVLSVLKSGAYINGPEVKAFEREMEAYLGVRHAIGCANGTEALQIAMMALDIKPGDEVITTPFTFVATTETIALLGARPVYVDIDPKTFNIDPEKIESRITSKTKAIIPVHLFGQPCDITRISEIAKKHGLAVIEDSAQAVGARWKGAHVGTVGDISCTSFYPSKNLGAFGDGGMITTNDDKLADIIRSVANHGAAKTYHHDRLGVNSRLDSMQAAVLRVKLRYLDEWNGNRSSAARVYSSVLSQFPDKVQIPYVDPNASPIWHQYSLIIKGDRAPVMEQLKREAIPHSVYYPIPLHMQEAYSGFGARQGDFPLSEFAADHILSLPMHSELDEETAHYIATKVAEAL
jgi:UDP-2-acetamido-2-deoxy-ribo-hexuluronate aminotransferase